MRKISSILMLLICISISCRGDDKPADQKQVAVDLVNAAIDYYKANGKDKAFAEISKTKGQFTKDGGALYVFVYDMVGTVMAHGQKPETIGLNSLQAKDKNGVYYVKDHINVAKTKGEGWHDYMFKDPKTGKTEPKTSFVKKQDDFIFGCGIYK